MKIALIYPPTCDLTAPYLALPSLAGYLRAHGVEVLLIDANVEAFDFLFQQKRLTALAERLEHRLKRLEQRSSLSHTEQLAYAALWQARGDGVLAPKTIETAVAVLRDRSRKQFFDAPTYESAVAAVESALSLISAAYTPLTLNFTAYRTPFSLLTPDEIQSDARPERNPFHDYYQVLSQRLQDEQVDIAGLSLVFPGQIQPAYALAHLLRKTLPQIHLTCGGPAITQLLVRLRDEQLAKVLAPFHSAVIFEGEEGLLGLIRLLERGATPPNVIHGKPITEMSTLPAPDFDGLPLDKYFSPELVLPYDPTRGCYWGVCAFCHYGLAEVGTARYRERPVALVMRHLGGLAEKYHCRIFYFSQDAVAPKTILKIARAIRAENRPWRWATDMRPEKTLTLEHCQELAAGGGISMALGVESGSDRVLKLIDKGIAVDTIRKVIQHLSAVGISVEAMCFTDFPTETFQEALSTLRLLEELYEQIALFICGEFELTHGSLVARKPQQFGIRETWNVAGDELGTSLFYEEAGTPKSEQELNQLDQALAALAAKWVLRQYPWAGSLSTAHTLLWYERFGQHVFKKNLLTSRPSAKARTALARFDLAKIRHDAFSREFEIWSLMTQENRKVSRAAYRQLIASLPPALPHPKRWRYTAGQEPEPVENDTRLPHYHARRGRRQAH